MTVSIPMDALFGQHRPGVKVPDWVSAGTVELEKIKKKFQDELREAEKRRAELARPALQTIKPSVLLPACEGLHAVLVGYHSEWRAIELEQVSRDERVALLDEEIAWLSAEERGARLEERRANAQARALATEERSIIDRASSASKREAVANVTSVESRRRLADLAHDTTISAAYISKGADFNGPLRDDFFLVLGKLDSVNLKKSVFATAKGVREARRIELDRDRILMEAGTKDFDAVEHIAKIDKSNAGDALIGANEMLDQRKDLLLRANAARQRQLEYDSSIGRQFQERRWEILRQMSDVSKALADQSHRLALGLRANYGIGIESFDLEGMQKDSLGAMAKYGEELRKASRSLDDLAMTWVEEFYEVPLVIKQEGDSWSGQAIIVKGTDGGVSQLRGVVLVGGVVGPITVSIANVDGSLNTSVASAVATACWDAAALESHFLRTGAFSERPLPIDIKVKSGSALGGLRLFVRAAHA